MNKAVFLDRYGVINRNLDGYVKTIEELEIFPFVSKVIKNLNQMNFKVIVITNQSAINRGIITHQKLHEIHQIIQNHLKKNYAFIDAFYYCPHRPDEDCICRKPKSGLLEKAIQEFKINIKTSWMIGDNESDITAGKNIGVKTIKIKTGYNLEDAMKTIINCENK